MLSLGKAKHMTEGQSVENMQVASSRGRFGRIVDTVRRVERDQKSGLRIVEKLAGSRTLLESGEILARDGSLWGYRVYKGEKNWDFDKGISLDNPWQNKEQYNQTLKKFASDPPENLEDFENIYWNQDLPLSGRKIDQLAALQIHYEGRFNEKLGTSWSRSRQVAEFWAGAGKNSVVLVKDVPKEKCVCAEALLVADPRLRRVIGASADGSGSEMEITVFDFINKDNVLNVIKMENIGGLPAEKRKGIPHLGYVREASVTAQERLDAYN